MNQQQPMTGQNKTVMAQPPDVISTKDHLYLQDMLSWNLGAIKKMNFFAQQCKDQDVKQAIMQSCQMHQRHYQSLLNHLQSHVQSGTNPMGGMQ